MAFFLWRRSATGARCDDLRSPLQLHDTNAMISEEEARKRIIESVRALASRRLSLSQTLGCFAADEYFARLPLPTFDNSAMDGYAVVASSCTKGARLRVTGEQPAGPDRQLRISPGEAVRMFTGAPVPQTADAIGMPEDITREGNEILVNTEVKAAIVSTGDEIIQPGGKLESGQIYESNSALIRALLERCGGIVKSDEHCRDERESLMDAIKNGIKNHILIISGGVSVGEHDLVKDTLHELGAPLEIWRVAIKPGKPFLFGQLNECAFFGLPGNPVSAFVTFLQFVRPAILKLMGATNLTLPRVPAKLTVDLTNDSDRAHYIRGKLEHGKFTPVGRQESHALFGLSQSNALLRMARGQSLKADEIVDVHIWD